MGKATIRVLVRRYYADFVTRGDLSALGAIVHPTFRYYAPGVAEGMDGVGLHQDLYTYHRAAFADVTCLVTHEVIAGALAACRWRVTAIHAGPYAGVPARGRPIDLTGMDLFVIADDLIQELHRSYDLLELRWQLAGGSAWTKAGERR